MVLLTDDHRGEHGVEPICRSLRIVPSTYYEHIARRALKRNLAGEVFDLIRQRQHEINASRIAA